MENSFPHGVGRVAVKLYDGIGTPVAMACKKALVDGRWDDLASMRVDPKKYSDSTQYWLDACAVDFLRKNEDLPTSFDRPAKAVENFWKSEKECWHTNERLQPYLRDPREWTGDPAVRSLLDCAAKIVRRIIGDRPPQNIEGRFGPGATFADKGLYTTIPDKMSSDPTTTSSALLPWVFSWVGTEWANVCSARGKSFQLVPGNRFTTVPKDCEKDRGIAVEPSINLFYQLGLGRALRRALLKARLDLVNGQRIHRRVAEWASVKKFAATIDLSNASDTICRVLVELLLPRRWFEALNSLRSPKTFINGRWVLLEKFSSMGNGFTFELETLLFAAISEAALRLCGQPHWLGRDVFVFGDDIIVPTQGASTVIAALRLLGFTPNVGKTFVDGPFRESCGGDYFEGVDVRPFFLKANPKEPQELIALANGIRRAATHGRPDSDLDPRFIPAWLAVTDLLPKNIRECRGPSSLGDLVLTDRSSSWKIRVRNSIRYVRSYKPARTRKVAWSHFDPGVVLACAVYGTGSGVKSRIIPWDGVSPYPEVKRFDDQGGITPRDSVIGYRVGWTPYS